VHQFADVGLADRTIAARLRNSTEVTLFDRHAVASPSPAYGGPTMC